MKKAVIALLALCISLVAALALVGCGGSGPADKKADFIWFKVEVPESVSVSNSAGNNANKAQLTFSNNDRIIPLWEQLKSCSLNTKIATAGLLNGRHMTL